jgi:hypothetical protein
MKPGLRERRYAGAKTSPSIALSVVPVEYVSENSPGQEEPTMKVGELICRLRAFDLEAEVFLHCDRRSFEPPVRGEIMNTADLAGDVEQASRIKHCNQIHLLASDDLAGKNR